uniref:Uncharacterized protein n=1 Tax=Anguilla anguilla TaxID=7936 RepID=A0A0E9QGL1_ANGAN
MTRMAEFYYIKKQYSNKYLQLLGIEIYYNLVCVCILISFP